MTAIYRTAVQTEAAVDDKAVILFITDGFEGLKGHGDGAKTVAFLETEAAGADNPAFPAGGGHGNGCRCAADCHDPKAAPG